MTQETDPPGKSSRSPCAIANGLEVLGDRWTLLIIRDLMFTNRNEFGHLLHSGEGISTNILSDRLQRLQCWGIVEKLPHPEHGRKFIYRLTDRGRALAPVLIEFALWAKQSIAGANIPEPVLTKIKKDRAGLLAMIHRGEPVVKLDL